MALRFAALIPCYNVGAACVPVILRTAPHVEICLAVDDGSTDSTPRELEKIQAPGLHRIRHAGNQGKGAALLSGFRYLLDRDMDGILTLDGDGQHDPELIPRFIEEYRDRGTDLICGNRMLDQGSMPLHRKYLNRLSNWTISRICRQPIPDSQCGFRLYSRKLLTAVMPDLKTGRYELETEILIRASRLGLRIGFVPVSTIYSPETNSLSHHNFYDVLRIARLMTVNFFRS